MLKLQKDNALTRSQLAKKAKKKIPLYEEKNKETVKVPFLNVPTSKMRYCIFYKRNHNDWFYFEIVD